MKTIYIKILFVLFSGVFLAGCYTQVATRDRESSRYSEYEEQQEYTEDENYSGDEYSESYSDTTYSEDYDEVEINNYYLGGGPQYRRYYWGYYPSFSIGFGYNSWYDPWCWDPWYW